MSPFDAPVAYVLLAASLAVLLAAAVIANVRHPKTPAPARPAAQSRVGVGSTCDGCDLVAPVVKYHRHNYCQDCADEVAALHQMAVDKEIRAMDRRWGA